MPIIKVYLHYVWSTKNRIPFLTTKEIRLQLWQHLEDNAKIKGIYTLGMGGHKDHCHCLVSMCHDQTISKIAQLLKGESSFWINKTGLILNDFPQEKFDWQDEYFAESVSPHLVPSVQNYILIQEEHHHQYTLQEEIEKLIADHNVREN